MSKNLGDNTDKFKHSVVLECHHCGNTAPHTKTYEYFHDQIFDRIDDENALLQDFNWVTYVCGTCGALSYSGGFLF